MDQSQHGSRYVKILIVVITIVPPLFLTAQLLAYGMESVTTPSMIRVLLVALVNCVLGCDVYRRVFKAEKFLELQIQAKEKLLGMVSHDLKSPLAAIAMQVDLIMHNGPVDPVALDRLKRKATEAAQFVDDILEAKLAHDGSLQLNLTEVPLKSFITDLLSGLSIQTKKQGVNIVSSVEHIQCWCDRTRLAQILTNLLSNALKHSSVGGLVEIRVNREGPNVLFSIRDTGDGIPADKLKSIFEPFETLNVKNAGHGLGLSIVRDLVKAHGGLVWAESEIGHGATFLVTLPCRHK